LSASRFIKVCVPQETVSAALIDATVKTVIFTPVSNFDRTDKLLALDMRTQRSHGTYQIIAGNSGHDGEPHRRL
jgi:hypothetical protein